MTAYLITYGATPADRLAAYRYETRREAWTAGASSIVPQVAPGQGGGCAYVVETDDDVRFGDRLIELLIEGFGGQAPRPYVRARAVQLLLDRLFIAAVQGPSSDPSSTEENHVSDDATMTEERTETAPDAPKRAGRQPIYRNDQTVTIVPGATKPGRPMVAGMKNHQLFETIKAMAPTTPLALRKAGVTSGYLEYFERLGLVMVT